MNHLAYIITRLKQSKHSCSSFHWHSNYQTSPTSTYTFTSNRVNVFSRSSQPFRAFHNLPHNFQTKTRNNISTCIKLNDNVRQYSTSTVVHVQLGGKRVTYRVQPSYTFAQLLHDCSEHFQIDKSE